MSRLFLCILILILLSPYQLIAEKLSVYALDLETHDIVRSLNQEEALTPASTAKLFTLFQAIKNFGPDFQFEYDAYLSSESDLIITIPPDPLFTTEIVFKLVERIKALGIPFRSVVLDTSNIIGGRYRVGTRAYESAAKGVFFNFNSIEISFCPTKSSISVQTFPQWGGFTVVGKIATGETMSLQAECQGTQCKVSGTFNKKESCQSLFRSVDEPENYLQRSFTRALKEAGILVTQGVKVSAVKPAVLEKKIFSISSRPLSDAVSAAAHYSTNVVAEALVFLLGKTDEQFRYEEGMKAIQEELRSLKASAGEILVDGSGLSHENRVSTKTLVALLERGYSDSRYSVDIRSMFPIGGESGTLKTREFGEAAPFVRAKTGSLDGVSALAGYIRSKLGHLIAFSILQDGITDPAAAKQREEAIVLELYMSH